MTASAALSAVLFDGRQARGRPVRLTVQGGELLAQDEDGVAGAHKGLTADAAVAAYAAHAVDLAQPALRVIRWPLAQLQWPERTRHGRRVIHLPGGGAIECADSAAFDAWRQAHGPREGWVVRAQQHWRATLAAVLLLLAVLAAGYVWGLPFAADRVVALVPQQADSALGEAALGHLRGRVLLPSQTPPARQQALQSMFSEALAAAYPAGAPVPWQLHFHAAPGLGPNALALPGGHIVITDQLLRLLDGHDDTVLGVLAHEYGHLRQRHGMRALARVTLVGMAAGVALGDFSGVLAGVPALLAQLDYSRQAEREADAEAVAVLRASGRSPAVMVLLFERLARIDGGVRAAPPVALASHPADAERIEFFRAAAR